MSKNLLLLFSLVAVVIVASFAADRNTAVNSASSRSPSLLHRSPQSPDASDHAIYEFLFRNVVRLREKTRELQKQGRIGPRPYFPLKTEAGLTVNEATALEAIAVACNERVTQQDEKAKAIITAFQSRFPGEKVPRDGAPPPPPELKRMWDERKAMVLSARDQLRLAFGEQEFARLDHYAKTHYNTGNSASTNPDKP